MPDVLHNEDGDYSVLVTEHNDAELLRAAHLVVDETIGGEPGDEKYGHSLAVLVGKAERHHWAQHDEEGGEETGCGCEPWFWCSDAPGDKTPVFVFPNEVILEAEGDWTCVYCEKGEHGRCFLHHGCVCARTTHEPVDA